MTTRKVIFAAATLALCNGACSGPTLQDETPPATTRASGDARGKARPTTRPQRVAKGWLSWRGPQQNGTSLEKGLPDKVSPTSPTSWMFELAGRGTPVIANGRVYTLGYEGVEAELQEILMCLDEHNGKKIWEHRFTDFITDLIYYRYAIGSPTIDPATGNILCMSSAGLLTCFTSGGKLVWQRSMMSEYGRLTFPNGRTGAPLVDGDLCIMHVISSSWGPHAPARDRFYAFDKDTGEPIWSATPGGPPKDSSFSFPALGWEGGKRVLYAGLGGGNVVCVNVLTGDPIWRFQLAIGGLNCSPLIYKDTVIAIHGKENVDDSTNGRMVALKRAPAPMPGEGPIVLGKAAELWRNELTAFTSSPVLAGNRIYQTTHTGELHCVDADTGKELWHEKLAPDQIHASPVWGDGKLYVPMNNGTFHIVKPSDSGAEILQTIELEGNCLGAPAIAHGRIYVHTTDRLYCFAGGSGEAPPAPPVAAAPEVGDPVRLQIVPGDILLRQGEKAAFRVRSLDANGRVVSESVKSVDWADMPGDGIAFTNDGGLQIASDATPAAFIMRAESKGMRGTARVRIVRGVPYKDNFENAVLKPHPVHEGVQFAPPRPYWVGAGKKWEIRELDGNKVLAKTLDNPLFQRTMSMIGHPKMSNYTMQIDLRTDGNRRTMSSAGVVNQRYLIVLKGNHQQLEVSSNMELLKRNVPFRWKAHKWYTLKTRVDIETDGSGWIRAKVWPRGEDEPKKWTIAVPHRHAHIHGSPAIYGFVPQSRFRVYIDNISVTSND